MSRGGIRRKLAQLQDGGSLSQSEGFWQQPDRKEQMCVLVVLTACMVSGKAIMFDTCQISSLSKSQSYSGFFF